jgi:hypothetical protein
MRRSEGNDVIAPFKPTESPRGRPFSGPRCSLLSGYVWILITWEFFDGATRGGLLKIDSSYVKPSSRYNRLGKPPAGERIHDHGKDDKTGKGEQDVSPCVHIMLAERHKIIPYSKISDSVDKQRHGIVR